MICAALIVKNEAATIGRCLRSLWPLVDHVVIVDTGSTDATRSEALATVPKDRFLYWAEQEWLNFGANRSALLDLARKHGGDWLLLVDADMTVSGIIDREILATSTVDRYNVEVQDGDIRYRTPRLIRASKPYYFEGFTHEWLACSEPEVQGNLEGLLVTHHGDGGSRSDKLTRDEGLLSQQLSGNPDDPRSLFYLAQTYEGMKDYAKARKFYGRRADLRTGWEEERWYAEWKHAGLNSNLNPGSETTYLLRAYESRPWRAEPLHELSWRSRSAGKTHSALLFAEAARAIPYPAQDHLFVHRAVYDYLCLYECSIGWANTGKIAKAIWANNELLHRDDLPTDIRESIVKNLAWCDKQAGVAA